MNIKRRIRTVIFIVFIIPITCLTLAYLTHTHEATLFINESSKSGIFNGSSNSSGSIVLRSSKENKTVEIKSISDNNKDNKTVQIKSISDNNKDNKTVQIKSISDNNSTVIFPRRSPKLVANQLQVAKEIMKPVTEEMVNIRRALLSSNYTWKAPGGISTVLDSGDHSFTATLAKSTMDILHYSKSPSETAATGLFTRNVF